MTAVDSQLAPDDALTSLFGSGARVAVLRLFMLDPNRAYYQRQIEAATGLAIRAVQRELERLNAIGMVFRFAQGNRTYYQLDLQFPYYAELRAIMLKTATPLEQLRAALNADPSVELALLHEAHERVLVVAADHVRPDLDIPEPYQMGVMAGDEFRRALAQSPDALEPFLSHGVDLLGRREDVVWRRIEAAGYTIPKAKGVP